MHNLAVDAYAMQHSEEYGRSAKSFVAHLVGLCCGVEAPGDRELYWAIPRWLDGPARLTRPVDIHHRGGMTIDNVRRPPEEADYPELVRKWGTGCVDGLCRAARDGARLARRGAR
jgi:hypothetical protein